MSNLTETSIWTSGIYQLETTDKLEAGPGGIDNLQAQQLVNRTLWLKNNKPDNNGTGATGSWGINAATATALETARTISLTGGATASGSFDGSANLSLSVTLSEATTTALGAVEKATNAEAVAGTADKFPDAAGVQYAILNPASKDAVRVADGIYHGRISSTGTAIRIPSGWSVSKTGTGIYEITHNLGTVNYSVIPSIYNDADSAASVMTVTANTFEIYAFDANNSARRDVDNAFFLILD